MRNFDRFSPDQLLDIMVQQERLDAAQLRVAQSLLAGGVISGVQKELNIRYEKAKAAAKMRDQYTVDQTPFLVDMNDPELIRLSVGSYRGHESVTETAMIRITRPVTDPATGTFYRSDDWVVSAAKRVVGGEPGVVNNNFQPEHAICVFEAVDNLRMEYHLGYISMMSADCNYIFTGSLMPALLPDASKGDAVPQS